MDDNKKLEQQILEQQILEQQKLDQQKLEQKKLEQKKLEQQHNVANNAKSVQNVADIASKSANPYAKAAGIAVKTADKLTRGKASQSLGKMVNKANKFSPGGRLVQSTSNKLSENGTSNRISNALNKKKTSAFGMSKMTGKSGAVVEDKDNSIFSKKEVEEQTSDGGGVSFKATVKVIKIGLIAFSPIMVILIFMNLIVAGSQTYLGIIGLDQADKISTADVDDKIGDVSSEDLLNEEIDDQNVNSGVGYLDTFIDNEITTAVFISKKNERPYSEADLNELEDFYPDINGYKGSNMDTVYKFFFKLLYIHKHYLNKYNVDLDLALIMSILSVQSENKNDVFIGNIKDYEDHKISKKEENEEFSYYQDWSTYSSTKKNSSHDIEILAQNMVTKTSDSGCYTTQDNACYSKKTEEEYKEFLKEFIEKKYFTKEGYKSNTPVPPEKDGDYTSDIIYNDSGTINIRYYNQGDYAKYYFSSDPSKPDPSNNNATIANSGCGPTSLAIVLSSLLNKEITPIETTSKLCKIGGCYSGASRIHYLPKLAKKYGVKTKTTQDRQEVIDALGTNQSLVIALMGPGTFTDSGHFIVLTGVNSKGQVSVADPGNRARTKKKWFSFNTVVEQRRVYKDGVQPFIIFSR